jgi:hypothetical protein
MEKTMKKLFIILSVISLSTFKIALSNGVGPFLPIKHAVSRGDLDAVHRALMLPYSHINEKGVDGTTPLHEAFDNYMFT